MAQIVLARLSATYRVRLFGSRVSPLRNWPAGIAVMRCGAPYGDRRQTPDLDGSGENTL